MVKPEITRGPPIPVLSVVADEDPQVDAADLRRQLYDLTRLVSDWIWEIDSDLRFIWVSDRVLDVLGYHPIELQGRRITELGRFTSNRKIVAKLTARSPFRNLPCDMIARGGEHRQFLVSGLPIFCSESGSYIGFRGTAEDVTQRRAAEVALHRRDAVLDAVSRAASVLLASTDWRQEMPQLISKLGNISGADRVHLFEAVSGSQDDAVAVNRFYWCASPTPDLAIDFKPRDIPLNTFGFSGWAKRLRAGKTIAAAVDTLSKGQQWFLSGEGVKSVLAIPVFAGNHWWGFLRLDTLTSAPTWAEVEIDALTAAASIIGASIQRHRSERTLRASEARFATAFHTSPDAIVITRFKDGVVLETNEGFSQLTGFARDQAVGHPIASLGLWLTPSDTIKLLRGISKHGEVRDLKTAFRTRDGNIRIGSISAKVVEFNGERCVLSVARDMTRRYQADETIRKLSQAIEQSPALVMITDTNGSIEYVNPKFAQVTGYSPEEVIGQTPDFLSFRKTPDDEYRAIWDVIRSGREWRGEVCNRKRDGHYFWAAQSIAPIRTPDGTITHFVASSEDVTDRRLYQERLHHQTHYDPLTDLPNRTLFFDRLTRSMVRARRDGSSMTLMFIDLDGFKFINDGLGPAGGDAVLQQVARRLSNWVGPTDTAARLASDEFAVVLTDGSDHYHATAVVPEILEKLGEPFQINGSQVFIHASIGIAVFPDDGKDEYALLKNADAAMLRAKELGGNAYQFFAPGMNAEAAEFISLGCDLRQALQRDEFDLYYQPVVDISSGRVVGAEALLRWQHPQRGFVPPERFIGLAEESGLIEPIGEWVLRQACRQNKEWRDQGFRPIRIAVNVSSRQLQRGRLIKSVFAALSEAGLPPSSLGIELTESAFVGDVEDSTETLRKLNNMGIAISVDDFGTGYSSLSYLRKLPLSTLKIDRSFVQDVTTNPDAAAIADVIIAMAHRLHLKVIAEGVEEASQLDFLRDKGCEMMQGYYFSKPVPATEFTDMLRNDLRLASSRESLSHTDAKG
jgi:diguanylate cyclase (GGDEF)-like protein/PAS domain S-box-containing protein